MTVKGYSDRLYTARILSGGVPLVATGGTITNISGWRVHTFTSSGTFNVTQLGTYNTLEYLVIGGGGGGGGLLGGGGGGGGGYRSSVAGELSGGGASAEPPLTATVGAYSVVVGNGGAASASNGNTKGGSGGNSSLMLRGLGSISLPNTSASVSFPTNAAFSMASGDFTIECWYNVPTFAAGNNYLFDLGSNGTRVQFYNNQVYFSPGGSNSAVAAAGVGMTTGTWHHLAMVRSGSTVTGYINGVSVATMTYSASMTDTRCTLGDFGGGAGFGLSGNISNFRIVKGTAVYTSAFTPPTSPLTAITGTSILTAQSSLTITDASANAFTATANAGATASSSYPTSFPASGIVISPGGGGGGSYYTAAGLSGGSGGGGSNSGAPGTGTANRGYSGGISLSSTNPGGSGGGGAGAAGLSNALGQQDYSKGGAGGAGLISSITGTAIARAGGGGGGAGWGGSGVSDNGGAGGSGGGGSGGSGRNGYATPGINLATAVAGSASTGGGGGGARYFESGEAGAAGGSGIVIVRYRI